MTTEEHLQLGVLVCYVFEWMDLQLTFGPIFKDSGFGTFPLNAQHLGELIKEPGMELPPIQPVKNGCLFSIINDLATPSVKVTRTTHPYGYLHFLINRGKAKWRRI